MPTVDTSGNGTVRRFDGRIDPLQLRSLLLNIVTIVSLFIIVSRLVGVAPIFCRGATVGRSGLAAGPCRRRRRSNRARGLAEGARALPAKSERRRGQKSLLLRHGRDASHDLGNAGRRFYVICEADRSFRAISAGHGGGRNLKGIANFANGKRCAKNFSNAMDSRLTTGGAYVTSETITSFKGYYRVSAGKDAAFDTLVRAV